MGSNSSDLASQAPVDEVAMRQANERLQAYNDVLLAQTEMLLEQHDEIRAANQELARINEAKDELLGLVSHELRTPLAIIKNGLVILQKQHAGPLTPDQTRFVTLGLGATNELARILDDILDWQKLMAGKALCEPVQGDLNSLLEETVSVHSAIFEAAKITLEYQRCPTPLIACFDPGRIRQVLYNLLSNAAKFASATGRVCLIATSEPGEVRVAVVDDGPGIPAQERDRVFEPFVQLDSGRTRAVAGTGLGLSICKKIIENGHGGRISVYDSEGGGATLEFAIPRVKRAEPVPEHRAKGD
jgi:signal transduction histidine kinase